MHTCRICQHEHLSTDERCPNCAGYLVDEVWWLLKQDLRPEAITLVQERAEVDVVEACMFVNAADSAFAKIVVQICELLERGERSAAERLCQAETQLRRQYAVLTVDMLEESWSTLRAELIPLAEARRKFEAVVLYKERVGVEVMEAKSAVEALEQLWELPAVSEEYTPTFPTLDAVLGEPLIDLQLWASTLLDDRTVDPRFSALFGEFQKHNDRVISRALRLNISSMAGLIVHMGNLCPELIACHDDPSSPDLHHWSRENFVGDLRKNLHKLRNTLADSEQQIVRKMADLLQS